MTQKQAEQTSISKDHRGMLQDCVSVPAVTANYKMAFNS